MTEIKIIVNGLNKLADLWDKTAGELRQIIEGEEGLIEENLREEVEIEAKVENQNLQENA